MHACDCLLNIPTLTKRLSENIHENYMRVINCFSCACIFRPRPVARGFSCKY